MKIIIVILAVFIYSINLQAAERYEFKEQGIFGVMPDGWEKNKTPILGTTLIQALAPEKSPRSSCTIAFDYLPELKNYNLDELNTIVFDSDNQNMQLAEISRIPMYKYNKFKVSKYKIYGYPAMLIKGPIELQLGNDRIQGYYVIASIYTFKGLVMLTCGGEIKNKSSIETIGNYFRIWSSKIILD